VKQSDLGEYEENAKEKQKIHIYKIKHKQTREVVSPLMVSHSFVEDWVFGY
jgi:hypothetical protein